MRTIRQIEEGFFQSSGAGEESAKIKIIEKYGIKKNYTKNFTKDLRRDGEAIDIDLISFEDGYTVIDLTRMDPTNNKRTYLNSIAITTDEKDIKIKFKYDDNSKGLRLTLVDCPNISDLSFIDPDCEFYLNINNCGVLGKGLDLSTLKNIKKFSSVTVENSKMGNVKNYELTCFDESKPSFEYRFDETGKTLGGTDFKNLSSKVKEMMIYLYPSPNLELRNIPKHVKSVLLTEWPLIFGDIDFGFGELIIDNIFYSINSYPANLEEWMMNVDLKGTKVRFNSSQRIKGIFDKMRSIRKKVLKKRPELEGMIVFDGE